MSRAPLDDGAITFEGAPLPARAGETIAAALARAGIVALRETRTGAERGIHCGMGVCQDCLVTVDGRANQRACMTKVSGRHDVRRQSALADTTHAPAPATTPKRLVERTPEICIVGAGAGGLCAAIAAAQAGAEVLVLDERPKAGGQYYKQRADAIAGLDEPAPDAQAEAGRRLIRRALEAGVTILSDTLIWGAFEPLELACTTPDGPLLVRPRQLIVAAGAYERAFPVPGWTLPGVMTTGAAQTLLRSYEVVAGARILVAGNGPLNLQVAIELARAGARVVGVVEAAPAPGLARLPALARMALADASLVRDGLSTVAAARRLGVPILNGRVLVSIEREADGLVATSAPLDAVESGARTRHEPVDVVAVNHGFLPSNEIARTLGAAHGWDAARRMLVTTRDATCRTSVPALFAVGDCCGLGGAPAAREEGTIAGLAAAGALGYATPQAASDGAHRRLARHRAFQKALWDLYRADLPAGGLPARETHLCRCEEVSAGAVDDAIAAGSRTIGDVKRRTRAGMGRCQGRYCAPLVAERLARATGEPPGEMSFFAPRVPFKPVSIAELAGEPEPEPESLPEPAAEEA
ncbi:FAD-dependent oxidoreductase [Salinarimonas ramus]|uniref:(2Fe-2S)-binding protein n=1 Tax=Salinarimonas ramus TaxID=690164 RepID=A0A917QIP6_9HYPH|nr:FAD-dependent oxidoreductase [Salinarimonas ramus]GGK50918.1 (2Fe-2S)-binding protein [Salinarimonas ramus]